MYLFVLAVWDESDSLTGTFGTLPTDNFVGALSPASSYELAFGPELRSIESDGGSTLVAFSTDPSMQLLGYEYQVPLKWSSWGSTADWTARAANH